MPAVLPARQSTLPRSCRLPLCRFHAPGQAACRRIAHIERTAWGSHRTCRCRSGTSPRTRCCRQTEGLRSAASACSLFLQLPLLQDPQVFLEKLKVGLATAAQFPDQAAALCCGLGQLFWHQATVCQRATRYPSACPVSRPPAAKVCTPNPFIAWAPFIFVPPLNRIGVSLLLR